MSKNQKPKWCQFEDEDYYGYRKTEAFIFGLFLFIMSFFLLYGREFGLYNKIMFASYRAICVPWTIFIAEKQNKSKLSWGFLALCFPAVTLMIIAKSNKK